MSRPLAVLFAFAVLSPGCIPVTEPLGDVGKAEPDKILIGKWSVIKGHGTVDLLKAKTLTIDAPDVKGNPKGLMRCVTKWVVADEDTTLWFFPTTVGKHTYASVLLGARGDEPPAFHTEGSFAKWTKEAEKRYLVCRYARDGDTVKLNWGNDAVFRRLMQDAGIKEGAGEKAIEYYPTPAGWVAGYLEKTGPDKLFDGTNLLVLAREKK